MKKLFNYFEAPLPDYIDRERIDRTTKFSVVKKEIADKTAIRIKKILDKIYSKSASARKQSTVDALEKLFAKDGQLGKGTARTVFLGNKNTVIKIAHNEKGLAQNQAETEILDSMEIELDADKIQLLPKLVDYDRTSYFRGPVWLELEKAQKVTPKEWEAKFGINFKDFGKIVRQLDRPARLDDDDKIIYDKLIKNENGANLADVLYLLSNTYDVPLGDFDGIRNWGKIGNRVVMVDLGLTQDVYNSYYKRKPKPRW